MRNLRLASFEREFSLQGGIFNDFLIFIVFPRFIGSTRLFEDALVLEGPIATVDRPPLAGF